jgi:type VI secretion system protein VasD
LESARKSGSEVPAGGVSGWILRSACGVLLLTATGCGGPTILPVKEGKKCEIQVVSLSIVASPLINPTIDGEPRPVQMRIYQLKDDVRLQASTFEQVWKEDATVLGADVVKRDDVFVYPNTRVDVKFERDASASHIVGAALFRNPKGRSWYASFELPPAPGKGDCMVPGCEDGKCGGPNLNPKFSMWVDATRVDDGADHLGDVTDGRRIRVVQLSKPVAATPSASGPSSSPGAPSEAKP